MTDTPHPVDVTVLVATRNRCESLQRALASLAGQETDGAFTYEILVVDNGDHAQARAIVEAAGRAVRYVREPVPGKAKALNRGLAHTQGRAVAFFDDDQLATPRWLWALQRCLEEERADAVTGRMLPEWGGERPAWLTDRLLGVIGCPMNGDQRVTVTHDWETWWCGGNAIVRRSLLEHIGGFVPHLERAEDSEFIARAARAGARICYTPDAVAFHRIPAERLTPAYVRWWFADLGRWEARYRFPWRWSHHLTIMPLWWYGRMGVFALKYAVSCLLGRSDDQLWYHLWLVYSGAAWRERWRQWRTGAPPVVPSP